MRDLIKNRLILTQLLAIATLTTFANTVRAEFPQPDANGDYPRNSEHHIWEIVDSDPNGLNCRVPRGCSFNDIMGINQCPGFDGDFLGYPARGSLQAGERFHSFSSNAGAVFRDNRRLPWLFVGRNYSGGVSGCFVRANSSFVQPAYGPNSLRHSEDLPMNITFIEEMVGITVPDRETTRPVYGGALRAYDVHIAKIFEVTKYFCDKQNRRQYMLWNYSAGGGSINMGTFKVTCQEVDSAATMLGLGEPETTTIRYSGEEGSRREETLEIPVLNIEGPGIDRWLNVVENFTPIR